MTKSTDSYRLTRYNRLGFAEHVEGPMPCLGTTRCRHRYCDGVCSAPSDGDLCPFETELARRLETEFRSRWDKLTITPDVDNFDDLVREHVSIYLQRGRAMTRMNKGWERRTDDGGLRPDAYAEFELSNLYLDRLWQREQRLQATLEEGLDRMRERAERLRPHLHVMEAFVAGKKAANDVSQTPREPVWDEFADADRESA